jgi:hypothetical protein
LGLFFLKDKLWRVKFILKNKILLLILFFMCRALESELVQCMQPTLQVYTRLKNKRLRELIRAAVIATRQLDVFVNGIIKKEERTKATYLEVERHARGGWLLRWAETNLLTDAVCIYDAEIDEQNLGQSLIDTVVQKTAHRSQRRQPKQAAAAAAATTTVLAANDEVMNVGQDMHDPVRVTNVVQQQQQQQQQQQNRKRTRKTDNSSSSSSSSSSNSRPTTG